MHPEILVFISLLVCCTAVSGLSQPAANRPVKVVLDTDIGDDIDDAYALALLTALPNAQILGVTTASGDTDKRAELAAKLLRTLGRSDIPVHAGRRTEHQLGRQWEWARGFHSPALKTEGAVPFLKRTIERYPGEITLIAIGPLTNLGDLFTQHPEVRSKIRQIVIMGGAVYDGYNCQPPPVPEWNIVSDVPAARAVFTSGVPLVMAGLEVTAMMRFDAERQKHLYAVGNAVTDALAALTALWGNPVPVQYDPVAVAHALGHSFCDTEQRRVIVEDNGLTRIVDGAPNVTVLTNARATEFLDWFGATLTHAGTARPRQSAEVGNGE